MRCGGPCWRWQVEIARDKAARGHRSSGGGRGSGEGHASAEAGAGAEGWRTVAIHINYANRPEAQAESDYIQGWCERLGISWRVHRMDDSLRRGHTARDVYERESRTQRYDMYRRTIEEEGARCPAVLVGHHQGDLQENVISNVMKGSSLLDIGGAVSRCRPVQYSTVQYSTVLTAWRPVRLLAYTSHVFILLAACVWEGM